MSRSADDPVSEPASREELLEAAAQFAETVPLDVPVERVEWALSDRAKRRSGHIEVHLLNDTLCNPITITLTWDYFRVHGWEAMKDTIRHELIHLWEYAEYGESSHGDRFEQKAREIGASLTCEQFVTPRYELECAECGGSAGSRYVRSKIIQLPEVFTRADCPCEANLCVTDTETGATWTSIEGFREANPDHDELTAADRYVLTCASCGVNAGLRQRASRPVRSPELYEAGGCECPPGLHILDTQTGETWTSSDEYES